MQFALFNLTDTNCEEINKFLRTHKILSSSKVFNPQNNSWSFCIEYQQDIKLEDSLKPTNKKDYMKELSVEDFAYFRAIRECRRIVSVEQKIPAYNILLDSDIALLIGKEITKENLMAIHGFGEKKFEKYGPRLIELWAQCKELIPTYIEEGRKARGEKAE